MSFILRNDVYLHIMSGEPFDAEFITADRKRGTGGELAKVQGWMKVIHEVESSNLKVQSREPAAENSKAPNHAVHGTVNIFNPANSGVHPVSVHVDLIQFFNGKRVIN